MSLFDKTTPPVKPSEHVEKVIIQAILTEEIPPGSYLPSERNLSERIGITRPTLREALHRLERDGWISINHGKPTMVNDIWKEGNLNILGGIIRHGDGLSLDFIRNLLQVRADLAPSYTYLAVKNNPDRILIHLERCFELEQDPELIAAYDWDLHYLLTLASGNPIYTLIINGFSRIYKELAEKYFSVTETRTHSQDFYIRLSKIFKNRDYKLAYGVTKKVMEESIELLALCPISEGG